ncbi:MAG: phage tail sheath C-terminal domain-containing protein, partial [Aquabacterium sp.]|nr:phage tail sheath C-terminal domain-containing protein [Aquabacterium sp.]
SYLDSETLHQLTEITRRLRNRILQKYPRHKLASDGTRFGAGQAIVTPSVIRGEIMAEYSDMEQLGLVENAKLFAKYLIVERDVTNPNRINVLLPPDLVNQLRIFALLNQFRLNYAATA